MVAAPERAPRKLRRDIGFFGLLFVSFGSIIGAGWLFAALYASSLAGPAAVISWFLGGAAVMLLALTHAELGGMYPVAGGSARFPRYAFGRLIGFTSGWVAFLGSRHRRPDHGRSNPPIHIELRLLAHDGLGRPASVDCPGLLVAAALLLLFCTINVMGVRWLAETNMLAVCWKLLIPALTVVALIATSSHRENFSAAGGFMPFGWKGVFLALSSGGVIFACLGFEQAVQLGGETRNPRRNIPLAIIGGTVGAIVLYVALQLAFILALDPSSLSGGWSAVSFAGEGAHVRTIRRTRDRPRLGLARNPALLRTQSFRLAAPASSTPARAPVSRSRSLKAAISPAAFARLTPRGTPRFAIAFSFLCGLVIFLPFPSWQELVGFISAAAVVTYATAPLALGALRRQDPARPRPFRLPAASLLAPGAFVVANEILLFTGWAVVWKLIAAILIGFALLSLSIATDTSKRTMSLDWRSAAWLWPYLLGMAVISYLSSFDTRTPSSIPLLGLDGPRNELTFGWDILAVALLSLAVYAFAIRSRLPAEQALEYVGDPTVEESGAVDPVG